MRLMVLNGSPRADGNTVAVIEKFLDGMYDHYESFKGEHPALFTNTLNLHGMEVKPCQACDMCKGNGGKCIIRDDGQHVINKYRACDTIVFATPLYWWGVSAQLKAAMDRMYAVDKKDFEGKRVIVFTVGASGVDTAAHKLVEEQFKCICEHLKMELVAVHKVSTGAGHISQNAGEMEKIYNLYQKLL